MTTADHERWRGALDEVGEYDIYHLQAYHKLAEMQGEGSAVMLVFRDQGCVIAFPFLLRDIELPGICGASDGLRDATSVRALAGPMASREVPPDTRRRFHFEMNDFFRQNRVVSAYARLHPLLGQPALLEGCGETMPVAVMITIDLSLQPEEQFARYRKDQRYDVRKLRRDGFTCEQAGSECLDDFMRAYHQTMDKVQAARNYRLDRWYFEYLMHEMPDAVKLFVCRDCDGNVAHAGLVGASRRVIHGLYAGTADEYRRHSPSKLMFDAVRQWGCETGAEWFHVGGAIGDERDSLYEFKMSFGGVEHTRSTWRHVVDSSLYEDLCCEVRRHTGAEPDETYFPKYRWAAPG